MSKSTDLRAVVPDGERETKGNLISPSGPNAWFADAVSAYGDQAKAFTCDSGLSKGFVSKVCAGQKQMPARALFAFMGNRGAVVAFTRPMLASVDMIAVSLKTEVGLSPRERAAFRLTRMDLGPVYWPAHRNRMAALVYHCTGDVLEEAIDFDLLIEEARR